MKKRNEITIEALSSLSPIFKIPKVKIYVTENVTLINDSPKGEKQNSIFIIATPGIFLLSKKMFKKKFIINTSIPFIDIASIYVSNENISFKSHNTIIRISTPQATSLGTIVYFIKQVLFPISLCPITLNLDSNTLQFNPSTFPYEAQDIFYERFLSCIMKYEITNIPPITFQYPNTSNNYNNGIFSLKKELLTNPLFQPLMLSLAFEEQTKELEINDDISIENLLPLCSTFFSLNKFIKRVTFLNPDFTNAKEAFETTFSVPHLFKPKDLSFKYCTFNSKNCSFFESLAKIGSEITSLEFVYCSFDAHSMSELFNAIDSNDFFHSIESLHFTDVLNDCGLLGQIDRLCRSGWINMTQSMRRMSLLKCNADVSCVIKSFLFNETGVKILSLKQCQFLNEIDTEYDCGVKKNEENERSGADRIIKEDQNLNKAFDTRDECKGKTENEEADKTENEEADKTENENKTENEEADKTENEEAGKTEAVVIDKGMNNSNDNLNEASQISQTPSDSQPAGIAARSPASEDGGNAADPPDSDQGENGKLSNRQKTVTVQSSCCFASSISDHFTVHQAHIQTHKLKELDLEGCSFTMASILSLFTFLTKELISVSRLNLSFMKIDEDGFNGFIDRMSDFSLPSLKMFAFNANTMTPNQLDKFDDFLIKQKKLKALFLNGSITVNNDDDRKGLKKLLKIITVMDITQIGLRGAGTSKYDFGRFLTKFLKNLSLKGTVLSLDITNQSFDEEGIESLILILNTTPIQEFYFDGISCPDFECFLNLCEEVIRSDLKFSAWPFNECERLMSQLSDQKESEKMGQIIDQLEKQFVSKFGSGQIVFDLSNRPKVDTSVFREKNGIELDFFDAGSIAKRDDEVDDLFKECADTEKYFYEEPILKVLEKYEKAISIEKLAKYKK